MRAKRLASRSRALAIAVCALLVSSACGDDGGGPSRTSTSTTSAASDPTTTTVPGDEHLAFLDRPANPFPVTFTLDVTASVTEEIGADGGVLTTTGSDGTQYTLTIPEGAVLGPVEITMTPISLAESPLETAVLWGVELEPDGLALLEPGTLEIGLADADPGTTAFFGAGGGGEDFHLAFGGLVERAEVPIAHFSAVGAIRAQGEEMDRLQDEYRPRDREGQYVQELSTIFIRVEDGEALLRAVAAILVDWFEAVRQDVERASDGPTVERLFAEWLMIWAADEVMVERFYEDFDASDDFIDSTGLFDPVTDAAFRAGDALHTAMYELFREENLRCIQERDPNAVFAMYRWALLMAWLEERDYSETSRLEENVSAMKQCMRWELDFTSTSKGSIDPLTYSVKLEGVIPLDSSSLTLSLDNGNYVGPVFEGELAGTGAVQAPAGPHECTSTYPIRAQLVLGIDVRFGDLDHSTFTGGSLGVGFEQALWECGFFMGGIDPLWWPWWETHAQGVPLLVPGGLTGLELSQGQPGIYTHSSTTKVATAVGEDTFTIDVTLRHDPQLP